MTRRTAAERHRDSAPSVPNGAPHGAPDETTDELLDVLMAFHHPTRRWLVELLEMEGPASVGRLASRTGLAVGSVSHHLKALHRHGFIEPAPELARDTRESWWRAVRRGLSWSADDFASGTAARRVADAAEAENFRHQVRAVQQWLVRAGEVDETWRRAASSTDTMVPATVDQLLSLEARLRGVIEEWSTQCLRDRDDRPDAVRRPVRVIARAFPSGPVRP
jgi:DNA-binding transcriptional ArsR family regulator